MRTVYEKIKRDMLKAIDAVTAVNADAGQYLRTNIVFDDEKMTFQYIGDGRVLQIEPIEEA